MATVSNIGFPSVFQNEVFSKQRTNKKWGYSFLVPSNAIRLKKMNQIYCKFPESGVEENSKSRTTSNSKNRMEEYNIAMKKMMRNPYEYHHELGQFHFHLCTLWLSIPTLFRTN